MNEKTYSRIKRFGGIVLTVLMITSVLSSGAFAASGDADETLTVGSSGDYTTVQAAVDAASDSKHSHIVINTADYSDDASITLTSDDVYFTASTSGNAFTISELTNPYEYTYNTSSDGTITTTKEGKTESYEWTVGANSEYGTIQHAVDHSTENDIILIESGNYTENVTLQTENLTIKSQSSSEVNVSGTLNATNVTTYNLGDMVVFETIQGGNGGGGANGTFYDKTYYGIPVWLYTLAVVAVVLIGYNRMNDE